MRSKAVLLFMVSLTLLLVINLNASPQQGKVKLVIYERAGVNLYNYSVHINLKNCNNYRVLDEDGEVLPSYCDGSIMWVKVPYIPAKGRVTVYLERGKPGDPRDVFQYYEGFGTCPDYTLVDFYYKWEGNRITWYPYFYGTEEKPQAGSYCKMPKSHCEGGIMKFIRHSGCEYRVVPTIYNLTGDAGFLIEYRIGVLPEENPRNEALIVGYFILNRTTTLDNITSKDVRYEVSYYHLVFDFEADTYHVLVKDYFKGYTGYNLPVAKKTRLKLGPVRTYSIGFYGDHVKVFIDGKKVIDKEVGKLESEQIAPFFGFMGFFSGRSSIEGAASGQIDWVRIRKFVEPEPQVRLVVESPSETRSPTETRSLTTTVTVTKTTTLTKSETTVVERTVKEDVEETTVETTSTAQTPGAEVGRGETHPAETTTTPAKTTTATRTSETEPTTTTVIEGPVNESEVTERAPKGTETPKLNFPSIGVVLEALLIGALIGLLLKFRRRKKTD